MGTAAALPAQSAAHRDAIETGAPDFGARAGSVRSLSELTTAFAASIAAEGFDHHLCLMLEEGSRFSSLFGDMNGMSIEALRIARSRPEYPRLIVDGADRGLLIPIMRQDIMLLVLVTGPGEVPQRDRIKRVQALAETYADRGMSLFDKRRDTISDTGLSLMQRQSLALVLTGYQDFEIAPILGITALAVRAQIHHAMTLLEADTRAEAVAIAARRGLLIGLDER